MRVENISFGYQVAKSNKQVKRINNITFEKEQPAKKVSWIVKLLKGIWEGWTKACEHLDGCSGSL